MKPASYDIPIRPSIREKYDIPIRPTEKDLKVMRDILKSHSNKKPDSKKTS